MIHFADTVALMIRECTDLDRSLIRMVLGQSGISGEMEELAARLDDCREPEVDYLEPEQLPELLQYIRLMYLAFRGRGFRSDYRDSVMGLLRKPGMIDRLLEAGLEGGPVILGSTIDAYNLSHPEWLEEVYARDPGSIRAFVEDEKNRELGYAGGVGAFLCGAEGSWPEGSGSRHFPDMLGRTLAFGFQEYGAEETRDAFVNEAQLLTGGDEAFLRAVSSSEHQAEFRIIKDLQLLIYAALRHPALAELLKCVCEADYRVFFSLFVTALERTGLVSEEVRETLADGNGASRYDQELFDNLLRNLAGLEIPEYYLLAFCAHLQLLNRSILSGKITSAFMENAGSDLWNRAAEIAYIPERCVVNVRCGKPMFADDRERRDCIMHLMAQGETAEAYPQEAALIVQYLFGEIPFAKLKIPHLAKAGWP